MTKPLWEYDHPYYALEGNHFDKDYLAIFYSWDEFFDAQGNDDLDMNLLYRWDWKSSDPNIYLPREEVPSDRLLLFYMGQRKALARSVRIYIDRKDEPAVREWLTVRAEHLRKVWEPLI